MLLLRASYLALTRTAAQEDVPVECDEDQLKVYAGAMPQLFPEAGVDALEVPEDDEQTRRTPFSHIFAPFEPSDDYAPLWRPAHNALEATGHPFGDGYFLVLKTPDPYVPRHRYLLEATGHPFGDALRLRLLRVVLEVIE